MRFASLGLLFISSLIGKVPGVLASNQSEKKMYIDLPHACFEKRNEGCAYRAMEDHWIQRQGFEILITKGSSLAFDGDRMVQLMKGQFWLQAPELTLKSLGREFLLSGQVFASISKGTLTLRLHGGQVISAGEDPLLPGFERSYQVGKVSEPQAFDRQSETEWLIKNRVDQKFKGIDLKQWNLGWVESKKIFADRLQAKINRRIASIEKARLEIEKKRSLSIQQDRLMRQKMEQRFFNPYGESQ